MQLNEAVSRRLVELMQERGMTQYQLYMKSGVPKSTIGNLVNCAYPSMKLRIIHELCQGLEIDLSSFFASPLSISVPDFAECPPDRPHRCGLFRGRGG